MREALTFDDVLMVPKHNRFSSRNDERIDTSVKLGDYKFQIPIISSNMDTITGSEMAKKMSLLGGLGILHRFQSIEQNVLEFRNARYDSNGGFLNIGVSIGVNEGLDRATALYDVGARIFCIDVAHGHSESVSTTIKQLKEKYKDILIIAGNVCTHAGADFLVGAGADVIKVGIGPGCFVAGTKVVTDKVSKAIEKIKVGDMVLTHKNRYKRVVGIRKRIENDTIIDVNGTKCTKNHEFYVIDKKDKDKISDDNIHAYAKWVSAESLSDDYLLIKIKENQD